MNTRNYNQPGHVCPKTGRRCFTVEEVWNRTDLQRREVFVRARNADEWDQVGHIRREKTAITGAVFYSMVSETHHMNVVPDYPIYVEQDRTDRARCHVSPDGRGGFKVRRDGKNPIPGGDSSFRTIRLAVLAVKVLEHVEGRVARGVKTYPFWDIYARASGQWDTRRKWLKAQAAKSNMVLVRHDRHHFSLRPGPTVVERLEAIFGCKL